MAEYIFKSENDTHSLTRGIEDMCALIPGEWYGTLHEEIVRCRDCKYRYGCVHLVDNGDDDMRLCDATPNGFCAWGERKEA